MKKIFSFSLSFLLVLLIVLPTVSFAAGAPSKDVLNYKGVALADLPNKSDKVKQLEIPSNLKISKVSFNGSQLELAGEVRYQNNVESFNVTGQAYQSALNENDVVFNVTNEKETNLKVIFFKVYHNPQDIDLVANKFLKGKKTLSLYFFDETKRDLVSFNIPVDELGIENINGKDYEVDEAVTDAWIHKVMEGELSVEDDDNTFSIAAVVSKSDVRNFSANITYINPYGNGCNEQHAKNGITSVVGSNIMGDQAYVTSNVKVNSQGITYNCGPGNYQYVAGESAVWIGSYSDPVKIDNTFSGSTYVDFVKITKWWGSYIERSVYGIDVGLSVGYGPISVGTSIAKWQNFKPEYNQLKTVYFGGTDYSRQSNFKFTDSRLYTNGQYYTAQTTLGVAKATTSNTKKIIAKVTLPIYGNTGGVYYETKTYTPTLYYSNY